MADFNKYDDNFDSQHNRHSEDDVRRFRELLRNGGKDINNPEALEEIIQFYFEHEKFEDALTYADRLLSFQPYNADAWQRKGMILNNLFRYVDALFCFDKAVSLNPVDAEIYINRGITLDNLNRDAESLESFEKALELEPTNADALFNKAVTLEKLEKFDEAERLFRLVLDIDPENPEVW